MGLGQVHTLCFFCSVEDYNSYIANNNLTESSKFIFSCDTPDSPNSGGYNLFTNPSKKKKKK